jgi:spermidine synthase
VPPPANTLELEVVSAHSHIRVYRGGSVRCLAFDYGGGMEAVQTCVDLSRPDELLATYLRRMLEAPRYCQKHERVLLVGLGGGSLWHHYRKNYPEVAVDVVELDPVMVDVARRYFDFGGNVAVEDALQFIRRPGCRYDVVYVDAFLPPSRETAPTGAPLRLYGHEFLEPLKARMSPGGVASFNVHLRTDGGDDVRDLCRVFFQSYILPAHGASVVIGVTRPW